MSETNQQNNQQIPNADVPNPSSDAPSVNTSNADYEKPYNLEPNIEAALSYIPLVGIAVFLMEKNNKFVRFHALQSIFLWIAVLIAQAVVSTPIFFILVPVLLSLVSITAVGASVFAGWKAYNNEKYEFPVIGKLANDQVNK